MLLSNQLYSSSAGWPNNVLYRIFPLQYRILGLHSVVSFSWLSCRNNCEQLLLSFQIYICYHGYQHPHLYKWGAQIKTGWSAVREPVVTEAKRSRPRAPLPCGVNLDEIWKFGVSKCMGRLWTSLWLIHRCPSHSLWKYLPSYCSGMQIGKYSPWHHKSGTIDWVLEIIIFFFSSR